MTMKQSPHVAKVGKALHTAALVVPSICCTCSYAFMSVAAKYPTNHYELWGWNMLKDPFRCTVQLETSTQEWIFIHGHFVVVGATIIGLCVYVTQFALSVSIKASSGKPEASIIRGFFSNLKKANMLKIVALCVQVTVIVFLSLMVAFELGRVLFDFSENLELWSQVRVLLSTASLLCAHVRPLCEPFAHVVDLPQCAYVNGHNDITKCDVWKDAADPPSIPILQIYMVSGPLISLAIGLTFGVSKFHCRVLMKTFLRGKFSKHGSTAVSPSAVSSGVSVASSSN
jgi:hypothetical protein